MAAFSKFDTEREGQITFFETFGIDYEEESVLIENTDGISPDGGVLFEFKLYINDLNRVLFQAIKYLSKLRLHGRDVPADILLVSLNTRTAYHYKSKDYFEDIHKVYFGPASRNNEGFEGKEPDDVWYYFGDDASEITHLLNSHRKPEDRYLAVRIDENCIVPWAERYYREVAGAQKADFIGDNSGKHKIVGEIRDPKHFKGRLLPYTGKTNEKFKYLMDRLNENMRKKDTGAFYTPVPYCKKAAELLKEAIARVPEGNDYVIIDRCAGTGNLEAVLDDDILSHCILGTYEYYEYKVLCERLSGKVKHIIPPTEEQVKYEVGYVSNANAMDEEFVNNAYIKKFIDDPNTTIILFENPPYSEASSAEHQKAGTGKSSSAWKEDYVPALMKEALKQDKDVKGQVNNEKANAFIWSAFEFYLRQPTDSYVVFSPIKYWKYQHLISKKFINGFVFNRKWFHATASAITCILWSNEDDPDLDSFRLEVIDIEDKKTGNVEDNALAPLNAKVLVRRTKTLLSKFYDRRKFDDDNPRAIFCEGNGLEAQGKHAQSKRMRPVYNDNILGYLITKTADFQQPRLSTNLTRCAKYDGNGFYLRSDNFMEKLPLFAAGKFPAEDNWFKYGIVYKSFDGGDAFVHDQEFLNDCFIFACLSFYNKCRSFRGSDGRKYRNELCFDGNTVASRQLKKIEQSKEEKELVGLYRKILKEAKQTANYDKRLAYGIFQISEELNTHYKDENGKTVYDYPKLNADLNTLKIRLKQYYMRNIAPKLFEYQLLK